MFKVFFLLLLAPSQSWKLVFCVWQQQSKACYLYSLGCLPWLALQVALDVFSVMCSRAAQHGCLAARDQQNLDKYPSFFLVVPVVNHSSLWNKVIRHHRLTEKGLNFIQLWLRVIQEVQLKFFFYKIKKRKSGAECISLKNKEPASVFFSICRSKPALIWWERQTADLISLAGGPPLAFIQLKHYIGLSQSVFNLVNKSCFGSLLFQYCYTKKWL